MRAGSTFLAAVAAAILVSGCGWNPPKPVKYGRDVADPVVVERSGATTVGAPDGATANLDTKLVLACAKLWNATSTDAQLGGFAAARGERVLIGTWDRSDLVVPAATAGAPPVTVRHGDCVAVRASAPARAFIRKGREWLEVRPLGLADPSRLAVVKVVGGGTAWPRPDGSIGEVLGQ